MKKLLPHFLLLASLFTLSVKAQKVPPHRTCATMEMDAKLREKYPEMGTFDQFEKSLQEFISKLEAERANGRSASTTYNIPMIVHVIHNGEAIGSGRNISQAQVYSQYDVMNEDFNGLNADTTKIPNDFKPVKGSLKTNFKKALRDPAGNNLAEPGINRINRNTYGWTAPPHSDTYINGTIKPATIWDPTKYFNVWVADIGGGILGWAQFPPQPVAPYGPLTDLPAAGASNTDGVVVLYTAFGRVGNVTAPYNKGRTLTHEAGHFFALRHIWADETACSGDDGVADTPQQKDKNFGCPTYPLTAGGGARCNTTDPSSMFMNYMDYTDDACMFMLTKGQANRMEAVVLGSARRKELTSSNTADPLVSLDATISAILEPVGSSCVASITPVVTLSNLGSSTLTSVRITYNINGGSNSILNWTGSLASMANINITLNTLTASVGTNTFNVSTSLPNGGIDGNTTNDSRSQSFTITSPPTTVGLPFIEGFSNTTFPPTGWTLQNPNNNQTWTRVTTAGVGTPTASAKMDNFGANTNLTGQIDILTTPNISFAAANSTLNLTFDVAYCRYNNTPPYDTLHIEISKDCGSSWTKIFTKGGVQLETKAPQTTAFTPTATQWRNETINMGTHAGSPNVLVRFRNVSGWDNNLYIDNVNLSYTGAIPVAAFSGTPTAVCAGGSVAFKDESSNTPTAWSWTFAGGTPSTSTSQNPSVVYNTPGTYDVTLTATNADGSNTLTKTGYITVKAVPTVTATPSSQTICSGGSTNIALTSNVTGTTFNWTVVSTTGISGASNGSGANISQTLFNSGTTAGTATYTITPVANGCSGSSIKVVITINPIPTVIASPASQTICSDNTTSIALTSNITSSTFTWTTTSTGVSGATNGTGSLIVQTLSNTGTSVGTVTYTITPTSNSCSGTPVNVVITVNPLPTVVATPSSQSICSGYATNIALSSNVTGTGFSWTVSVSSASLTGATQGSGSAIVQALVNSSSSSQTATYTVTPVVNSCPGSPISVIVTVNPMENPSFTYSSSTYCQSGNNPTPTITGTSGGTFSSPNSGISINSVTGTINLAASTIGTYDIMYTTPGTCSSMSTFTITITDGQSANFSYNGPFCVGSANPTANITSGSISGTFSSTTGLVFASTSTGEINLATSTPGTYTVTNTVSGSGGCAGTTASANVVINSSPTLSLTSQTNTSCFASCDGAASVTGAVNYLWISGSSGPSASGLCAGNYSVTGTDANGCSSSINVAITQPAVLSVSNTQTNVSANGASDGSITSNATGGTGSYSYSLNNGPGQSSGLFTNLPAGTYTLIVTDANNCSTTNVITISQPGTGATISVTSTPASCATCCDGTATVNATGGSAPYVIEWTPATQDSTTATGLCAGTYTVCVTDNDGVKNCTTITISSTTGITNSSKALDVTLYPNPTSGKVNLLLPKGTRTASVKIFNYLGELILSQSSEKEIDLVDKANGIYYVLIQSESFTITKMITVQE